MSTEILGLFAAFTATMCGIGWYVHTHRCDVPMSQVFAANHQSKQMFGLVERDLESGSHSGTIVGFPHIEFTGKTVADVVGTMQEHAEKVDASGDLVLESEFVGIFRL